MPFIRINIRKKEETDMKKRMIMMIAAVTMAMAGCGQKDSAILKNETEAAIIEAQTAGAGVQEKSVDMISLSKAGSNNDEGGTESLDIIDAGELFTDRDMLNSPDISGAKEMTVMDGNDIVITEEGIYVLSGDAENATVYVEAGSEDKVQLVLNGLNINNADSPCIYVKNVDKVFITAMSQDNSLSVSGDFTADGDTNTDAVIFSKDDLVMNGTGRLVIASTDNGITSKDSIKFTGGDLQIECGGSAVEAHESILIAQGNLNILRCNDGLHAEDNDDDATGFIYVKGGNINITASDDAIHATTTVTIDNGSLVLSGSEGIEGTVIQINGGTIDINATDDGINAAHKSTALSPLFELNGGTVTVAMGAGDTDGVDSNGDIRINGGTISITGQSTFDYDGNAEYNGGTIIENGQDTNVISNQMMGGHGGMGGMGPQGQFRRGKQLGSGDSDELPPGDVRQGQRDAGEWQPKDM